MRLCLFDLHSLLELSRPSAADTDSCDSNLSTSHCWASKCLSGHEKDDCLAHRTHTDGEATPDAAVAFKRPRPKKSATTPKPSALLFSCVKNLSCAQCVSEAALHQR